MPEKTYPLSPWRRWGAPGVLACMAAALLVLATSALGGTERRAARLTQGVETHSPQNHSQVTAAAVPANEVRSWTDHC